MEPTNVVEAKKLRNKELQAKIDKILGSFKEPNFQRMSEEVELWRTLSSPIPNVPNFAAV